MKILDLDMDYFVHEMATFIPDNYDKRLNDDEFHVWSKEKVIDFIENNLGLSKERKVCGRIVEHHNETLYYWRELIKQKKLEYPFEIIHVDSHADLGLGYASWAFIFEELLGIKVEKRCEIESYEYMFTKYSKPKIGDYLLFALAFRWISKLTYVCNPNEAGNDYLYYVFRDFKEPNNVIELTYSEEYKLSEIGKFRHKQYLESCIKEPPVEFEVIKKPYLVNYNGDFDFITFCISPNYTPSKADYIIDIIKEYII